MNAQQGRSGLATEEQVAEWLQISVRRLRYIRSTDPTLRSIKVGRSVRFAWPDVHAWCAKNREQP